MRNIFFLFCARMSTLSPFFSKKNCIWLTRTHSTWLDRKKDCGCWALRIAWLRRNSETPFSHPQLRRRQRRQGVPICWSMSAQSWKHPSAACRTASICRTNVWNNGPASSWIWSDNTCPKKKKKKAQVVRGRLRCYQVRIAVSRTH